MENNYLKKVNFRKIEGERALLAESLQDAAAALESLKTENKAHNELVERSTRIMQEYFELRKEIVEISEEKEKLEEGKITAEQREKSLEKEMERWIEDINYERYVSNASIKRLSQSLDTEKLSRMKADVTRELVGKEREKIGSSFKEVEDKCKELEIDTKVKNERIQELENRIIQIAEEKDDHNKHSIKLAMELEKEQRGRRAIEKQKQKIKMDSNEGIKVKFYIDILHLVFVIEGIKLFKLILCNYCTVEIHSLKKHLETQRKGIEELEKESKTLKSGKILYVF